MKKKLKLKHWIGIGMLALVILIIVAVGSSDKDQEETQIAPVQQEETQEQPKSQPATEEEAGLEPVVEEEQVEEPKPKPKPTPQPAEPSVIQLSGAGQQASQKFTLESGLSIFRMTHSGQSNFQVWLLDDSGQRIDLLVNEIGPFNGAKAIGIERQGIYILDISADGQWTVKIEQPRPINAPSTPKTFTGTGQQVSGFVTISKGLAVFRMTHNGFSNFQVWLLNKDGRRIDLLVNEIGAFDGSKAIGIPGTGIYLLDISADGNWSISIE